ncbi:Murein DD-endopeptidase MepM [Acaryochloris thomasi RCC1774]|uniref:Murein DD-endopeptidase MepM n=1 Tax=Acaryochloris thomasi RCC1774 TaxID=1764569 RepID=A0A2W1JWX6_9CYAN|nr:M23 family metallopeptidase [Acaryochloris thomasi]PZD74662.1 Murein DD-endopeptidase MepM [Acaryochloris thomasi RCC1774]
MFKHLVRFVSSGLFVSLWAISPLAAAQEPADCRPSVVDSLKQYTITSGETLTTVSAKFQLLPTTLMGLNPSLRQGQAPAGTKIAVPPYNGILVSVPRGKTIHDLAKAYRVRPDVLFELNGCQKTPEVAFVPGVNWSPLLHNQPTGIAPFQDLFKTQQIATAYERDRYPLPKPAKTLGAYGWRVNPKTQAAEFYTSVDLAAAPAMPVYAVADGTVAFAGEEEGGSIVVINHSQGRQTRYLQLSDLAVQTGQTVQRGTQLGAVAAATETNAFLRFEVRSRSSLGWVAQDPQPYLELLSQQL